MWFAKAECSRGTTRTFNIFLTGVLFGGLSVQLISVFMEDQHCVDLLTTTLKHNVSQELNDKNNSSITAEKLAKEIRVLCLVNTIVENHEKKARHVKATWGRRCNKILFLSSVNDTSLPSIDLGYPTGRAYLWMKITAAFTYVYHNHLNEYDWFIKTDDDAYVIVENLRYLLSLYDTESPLYFGSKYRKFTKQGYMAGGPGYVLSRKAVKILVEEAILGPTPCKKEAKDSEDTKMGICLEKHGVKAGDTRDNLGRIRFYPLSAATHLISHSRTDFWYWDYMFYRVNDGLERCCSETAVGFHYISQENLYLFEYLIYYLKPFGLQFPSHPFPPSLPPDLMSVPEALLEKNGIQLNKYTEEEIRKFAMLNDYRKPPQN